MMGHRFRAPSTDGGVLAQPPIDECQTLAWSNFHRLNAWNHDFQGQTSGELRRIARQDLLEGSRAYLASLGQPAPDVDPVWRDRPLVLSGHQPELFHPGVWVKNFVGGQLAKNLGGLSAHIIVDNDLPKSAAVRVPTLRNQSLHTSFVEFDHQNPEVPFECWQLGNADLFQAFPTRVQATMAGLGIEPLLPEFWLVAQKQLTRTQSIGLSFAAARRSLEVGWGLKNLDIPLSSLCQTEPFLWFFCHLIAHLDRFWLIHNQALDVYRQANRIRSRNHPVPPLREQGEWREAPFWVWRAGQARRRSLMVARSGAELLLRISGEEQEFLRLPLLINQDAQKAVERLRTLPELGIALRTRALTTTLFSRLILSDLFIHGIGGAKYDELGDTILQQFFGIEPPGFLTLSLTLWLGLPQHQVTAESRRALKLRIRDHIFNPDRHLPTPMPNQAAAIVERKRAAIHGPVSTHAERASRCRTINDCNRQLAPFVLGQLQQLRLEEAKLDRELHEDRWARYREYPFVLFSEKRLAQAMGSAATTR